MYRVSDFMAAYGTGRSLTRQITDEPEMARGLLMYDIQFCNPFQSDSVSLKYRCAVQLTWSTPL